MIMMAGILFFLFVSFNYAFNSEHGLKYEIWKAANNTLSGDRKTSFDNLMPQLTQGFGISSVLCFFLAIVFFLVEAFSNPPREVE